MSMMSISICVLLCSDILQKLMAAMSANTKLALTSLNTSGNVIDEKGVVYIFKTDVQRI